VTIGTQTPRQRPPVARHGDFSTCAAAVLAEHLAPEMQYRLSAHRAANPPPLNAAALGHSFPSLGFASDDVPCSSNLVLAYLLHDLRALEYALGSSSYHDFREELVQMFFFDEACWYAERDDAPKGHAWMPLTSDRAAALCAFVSSRRLGLPAEALPAWAHELYLRGGAAPAVPLTAAQRRKEHAQEVKAAAAHGLYLFKQLERRVPGRFRSSDFILDGVWQAEQLRRQHEDLDDQADFDFEMGETYDEELQNDLRLFRGDR